MAGEGEKNGADQQDPPEQDQQKGTKPLPATPAGMKRVRLLRSIVLAGEHADADSIHDVANALAHRLVGEGSAEYTEPASAPTTVNRMVSPGNADPVSRQVAPAPPKGGPQVKGPKK